MKKNRIKKFNPGPITIMIIISVILMILSFLLNKIGFKGTLTDSETLETTTVLVKDIFTEDGISYTIGSSLDNFRAVEPLVAIIVSLITISILEVSGLLNHLFGGFRNIKNTILTFITVFVSIISTIIGDYSYAILLPLFAAIYRTTNKDPKVGVITSFIGITIGYGTGIFYNFQDLKLGALTQASARNVLTDYSFNPLSMLFIMIVSTIILTIAATLLIEKEFTKKVRKIEETELVKSKVAFRTSTLAFIIMLFIVIWSIIPGLPLSGWMIDNKVSNYIEKLFGTSSPFADGFLFIILCISLVCSYIYGKISRNIKDSKEFNKAISKTFQNTGFIFAGLFFASIMINILEWTNISKVVSLNIIEILNSSSLSGIFMVSLALLVSIIITIINPTTVGNWTLAAPVMVTNLVSANIDPAFAQMIFKVGDSIGKCFSPFYIFFIVLLGFLYKNDNQNEDISYFGTMRKLFPVVAVLSIVWIIIILGWNLVGLPIGFGASTTM